MKILHTADNHLGYQQYGLQDRLQDFVSGFEAAMNAAVTAQVDAVVIAGDLFHAARPPASAVAAVVAAIQRLRDRSYGIQVYGIDGNHDVSESKWLEACGIQPLDTRDANGHPEVHMVAGLRVMGINSMSAPAFREALKSRVAHCVKIKQTVDAMVIHMPLADLWGMGLADVTAAEIADAVAPLGVRHVMLGDIHDYSETVIQGVRFVYPGSTEVTASDQRKQKLVSVIDTETMGTEVLELRTRPFVVARLRDDSEAEALFAATDCVAKPMLLLEYNREVEGLRSKIEALFADKVLLRLMPYSEGGADVFMAAREHEFNRYGALQHLKTVLDLSFGENSEAQGLITALLDAPDDANNTLTAFMRNALKENNAS